MENYKVRIKGKLVYKVRIKGKLVKDDGWRADLPGSDWGIAQTGTCPDCGGTWVWAEAGNVPGTRECMGQPNEHGRFTPGNGCGSQFSVQRSTRPWHLRRERWY